MERSTSIRINDSTVDRLRLAGAEMMLRLGLDLRTHDDYVNALIDYWDTTKEELRSLETHEV